MRTFTLSLCLALAAGCNPGGGETTESNGGTETSTGGASTTDDGTTTPPVDTTPPVTTTLDETSTTTEDPTGPDTVTTSLSGTETEGETASTTDGSDSTTGDPGPPLTVSLLDIEVYADCMPEIDPDNLHGVWTVLYDNSAGMAEGSAELVTATLTLQGDVPLPFVLEVEPTMSGPVAPGEMSMQEQTRQPGLVPVSGCSHCDKPYSLDLVFKTGGEEILVNHSDLLPCVQ